jgi:hypothetical protein
MNIRTTMSFAIMAGICSLLFNASIFAAPRSNLALHKTATADSYVGARTPAMAVDGINSGESRWENNYIDGRPDSLKGNGWLYVDLGTNYLVDSVAIYWEHSGSGKYAIQVWDSNGAPPSNNDTGWTTLLTDTTLTYTDAVQRCLSFLKLPPRETRFVRMHSYKRLWNNPGWGISIYEFEVYGTPTSALTSEKDNRTNASGLDIRPTNSDLFIKVNGNQTKNLSAEIFSVSGQLIRRLNGSGSCLWNYKDAFGSKVTNGIYLIRTTSAGKTMRDKIAIYR